MVIAFGIGPLTKTVGAWPGARCAPEPDALPPLGPSRVELSVIIPVRDAAAELAELLGALAEDPTPASWEVITVDDGSADDLAGVIGSFLERLPLRMTRSSGRGPGGARNVGALMAAGEKLVFLDADDVPTPGFLTAMSAALERAPLAAPRLSTAHLNPEPLRRARRLPQETSLIQGAQPGAYGTGLAVTSAAFRLLGGFDESFRTSEDVDLCWRAAALGMPLVYVPEAVLLYRLRTSPLQVIAQAYAYGQGGAHMRARYGRAHAGSAPRDAARAVAASLKTLLMTRDPAARLASMSTIANRLGRIRGSIRHRVVFL